VFTTDLPIINGCEVSETFSAGFVNFYLGEMVDKPGHFKVWRQNPKESVPAWEKPFTSRIEARLYQIQRGLELVNDQRKRAEGLGIRKKLKELEH
jgi:hypothetical protein